jgi:hypothetical protein
MLAIGRGIMSDPKVMIIDELSLGLAPIVVQQLAGTLKALKESGMTILLVDQNVHLALALSDYAYVIAEGRPFTEGASAEVAEKPEADKRIWDCRSSFTPSVLPASFRRRNGRRDLTPPMRSTVLRRMRIGPNPPPARRAGENRHPPSDRPHRRTVIAVRLRQAGSGTHCALKHRIETSGRTGHGEVTWS